MKRRFWIAILVLGLVFVSVLFGSEAWIAHCAERYAAAEANALPSVPVAVVLGTTPVLQGKWANPYFQPRLESAATLFHAGKVRAVIASGDHGTREYDEPTVMKERLVALGVPAERVVCDYAGFRTLDSVLRAKLVFGQRRVIFVSQRFHHLRAVYLARALGMEAWGLDAADPPAHLTLKTRLREKFACVKALLDVHVLGTQPRFLGEPVVVPN